MKQEDFTITELLLAGYACDELASSYKEIEKQYLNEAYNGNPNADLDNLSKLRDNIKTFRNLAFKFSAKAAEIVFDASWGKNNES